MCKLNQLIKYLILDIYIRITPKWTFSPPFWAKKKKKNRRTKKKSTIECIWVSTSPVTTPPSPSPSSASTTSFPAIGIRKISDRAATVVNISELIWFFRHHLVHHVKGYYWNSFLILQSNNGETASIIGNYRWRHFAIECCIQFCETAWGCSSGTR